MTAIDSTRLAVQAHCLRREMAIDFTATLGRLRDMGFSSIELCSFPGCAGNPWGDFGSLATWSAARIRSELAAAELDCMSTHVTAAELEPDLLHDTLQWVEGVGCDTVVLAGFPIGASADLAEWRGWFERLNRIGEQLGDAGFLFAYHTQHDVWRSPGGSLVADEMLRVLDPARCLVELDASGALVYGADWMPTVCANPDRFFAMHLRDGRKPPTEVPWLPALPLGQGEVDWHEALDAAATASIPRYILEMEVGPGSDAFAALQTSIDYLNSAGLLAAVSKPRLDRAN